MSDVPDFYSMSDEELARVDLSNYDVWGSATEQDETEVESTQTEPTTHMDTSDESTIEDNEYLESESSDDFEESENTQILQNETDEEDLDTDLDNATEDNNTVDYQAFYEKLTKPFKANGREIQVTNPEDVIALMQQGANYSKKMAQLKPNIALMRTLEQHGLNSADKLAYLVDLHNKKPEAIAKLVKDADIDLYSFDVEQAEGYTPHIQVNEPTPLEDTINDLYDRHENFKNVINDVGTYWDTESKDFVANNPDVLRAMAIQADNGMYQQIMDAIHYERTLGRMVNIPFIQAYGEIENRILQAQNPQQQFVGTRPDTPNQDTNHTKKLKASTPKASGNTTTGKLVFDPLKVSDEEFLKYYNQLQFH